MKLFMFFINTIFWLWLFLVPTAVLGFIGVWLYFKSSRNLPLSIALGLAGFALGVLLAEYVRKHVGLDHFFGRISASPDLDNLNQGDKDNSTNNKVP
ncbi:MAG: hypothetical protein H7Y42_09155 [Chitinophagaceae bacterium]|nr:hypothetical protein [Chitinophagaceae bacterium]